MRLVFFFFFSSGLDFLLNNLPIIIGFDSGCDVLGEVVVVTLTDLGSLLKDTNKIILTLYYINILLLELF